MSRRKPNPDHKLASYSYGVAAYCSCGWRSETTYGAGAHRAEGILMNKVIRR